MKTITVRSMKVDWERITNPKLRRICSHCCEEFLFFYKDHTDHHDRYSEYREHRDHKESYDDHDVGYGESV